jgi:hypothetical protein
MGSDKGIWKSIIDVVGDYAPGIVNSIIPGGGIVTNLALDVVGGLIGADDNEPETIAEKLKTATPEELANLRKADYEFKLEMEKLKVELHKVDTEYDTTVVTKVNETMQAEGKSEHWPQYSWRPFWGFASGFAFVAFVVFVCMLAWKAITKGDANALTMIPLMITAMTTMFAIPGAILGVTAHHRGKAQIEQAKNGISVDKLPAKLPKVVDKIKNAFGGE